MLSLFAEITKLDHDQRLVFGYASTEALDSQGEVVRREALEAALPAYMRFANIREMHQPSAVGIAHEAEVDDKGLHIAARVIDDGAWEKVKARVYKGFSIGGRVTDRDPRDRTIITGVDLTEISLVDRPANPEATIELFKVAAPYLPEFAMPKSALAKSMQVVACLADVLDDIDWLQQNADGGIAAKLKPWLADGNSLLRDLIADETESRLDGQDVEGVSDDVDDLNVDKAATTRSWQAQVAKILETRVARAGGVGRRRLAYRLGKIGARHNKVDRSRIQSIHDHTVDLGAQCVHAKSATAADLAKLSPLVTEVATLKKRLAHLEALPLPAKGVFGPVSIAKEDDRRGFGASGLPAHLETVPSGAERADEILRHAYFAAPTTGR